MPGSGYALDAVGASSSFSAWNSETNISVLGGRSPPASWTGMCVNLNVFCELWCPKQLLQDLVLPRCGQILRAVAPRGVHRAGCRALTSGRTNATNLDAGELESQSNEKEK